MDLSICLPCHGQLRASNNEPTLTAFVVALQDLIYLTFLENEEEKNLRRISYLQATKVERMEVEEK